MYGTMRRISTILTAVALAALLVIPAPVISSADAEDATYGLYGAYFGVSMADINETVQEITGETLTEIINDLLALVEGYDIKAQPDFDAKFSTTRLAFQNNEVLMLDDQFAGVVYMSLILDADGEFPEAGEYKAKEGEDLGSLLYRVFEEEKGPQRQVHLDIDLSLFIEGELITTIDTKTGDLIGVDIAAKFMLLNFEQGNFNIHIKEEEPMITISYDSYEESGNGYLDLENTLSSEGLTLLSDEEFWECQPNVTEHMNALIVSADFAGRVWEIISAAMSIEDRSKMKIPELIMNIITSTNRMLDLYETVKSLTGTDIKDMIFTGECTLTNRVDPNGYTYVEMLVKRGDDFAELRFSPGPYTLDVNVILDLIPDTLIDIETRDIMEGVMILLGWNEVEVGVVTDPETEEKIHSIMEIADEAITYDEEFTFEMPTKYLITGIVLIAGTLAVAALMWRRRP